MVLYAGMEIMVVCGYHWLMLPSPVSPYIQLMSAMIEKMGDQDEDPLPQEAMDGCDSDEWSD